MLKLYNNYGSKVQYNFKCKVEGRGKENGKDKGKWSFPLPSTLCLKSSLSLSLPLSVGLTMHQFLRYGGDLCWLKKMTDLSPLKIVRLYIYPTKEQYREIKRQVHWLSKQRYNYIHKTTATNATTPALILEHSQVSNYMYNALPTRRSTFHCSLQTYLLTSATRQSKIPIFFLFIPLGVTLDSISNGTHFMLQRAMCEVKKKKKKMCFILKADKKKSMYMSRDESV